MERRVRVFSTDFMKETSCNRTAEKTLSAEVSGSAIWPARFAAFVRSPVFISAVVATVTLVTFVRVLGADFVMWDDDIAIYQNPNLGGLSLERLRWIFTDVDSAMRYYPLTLLSWSITYHFWGLNPFWYHLGNWLLHGANSVLVFLLLRGLLVAGLSGRGGPAVAPWRVTVSAALAALLWSLHPLRVEPVAWAVDRSYCQAAFFLLLSTLCYLGANAVAVSNARRCILLTISLMCYLASLLSHAIGMSFLFVFVAMDVYPLRRLGGSRGWLKTPAARRVLLEKIPFVAVSSAVALVTLGVRLASAGVWRKPVSLAEFSLFERLMQGMYVWAYYAWRPWYPLSLSPVYTTFVDFDPSSLPFIASLLAVVGAITALVFLRRRWPLALVLGICHLVLLVPALGLLESPHYHSDRYSLIVSLCYSTLLAACLVHPKARRFSRSVLCLATAVIVALGALSFRQTRVWNNSITLFEHMIATLGDDPYRRDIHWRLGVVLANQGNTTKAREHFLRTLQIAPNHPRALYFIAFTHFQLGEHDLAIQYFDQLLRIEPHHHSAHYYIGVAFGQQGQLDEAIRHLDEAVRIRPDWPDAYNGLGVAYTQKGQYDLAIRNFDKALQLDPGSSAVSRNLEVALKRKQEQINEDH
ncbi:MAG: tetratricopeptide repeat protein [Phycisphaerales bacterium]|nr:MAG: tetratricopeptide repeat protein [Phycisphaerales bacterium]